MESKQEEVGIGHEDGIQQGQAEVWKLMFAYKDTMAVRCAVELRIPDIIHSHGSPMSLSEIASQIGSPSPDVNYLSRIIKFLVRKKFFTAIVSHNQSGETLYGLTNSSRWLIHESKTTLAPMFVLETDAKLLLSWYHVRDVVKEGARGTAFESAHGCSVHETTATNPEFNDIFNKGIACTSKIIAGAIISSYKNGFEGIETIVDVGGGTGSLVAEIVKANSPRIKGINFDLQYVVDCAPMYHGVTHVGGDMFESVPTADAFIIKWVMHNWGNEDCLRVLRNCRKAMSKTSKGKLIIVEAVLKPEGEGLFDDAAMAFDLLMMVNCSGGKERTEAEWINLLEVAGFSQIKFINIPAFPSIIEAYAP